MEWGRTPFYEPSCGTQTFRERSHFISYHTFLKRYDLCSYLISEQWTRPEPFSTYPLKSDHYHRALISLENESVMTGHTVSFRVAMKT